MQDDDIFAKEMQGVELIEQDKADVGVRSRSKEDLVVKKSAAVSFKKPDDNYLSSFNHKKVLPYDIVGFKRPGIQNGVYRQFRLGKYVLDARLDLHGLCVDEARKWVFAFIRESIQNDLRAAIIIHGKGDRDKGEKAILKNHTLQWLEEIPEVLAFHSAQKRDGGAGAVYVLLKKSEKAKQKNRERFGLR